MNMGHELHWALQVWSIMEIGDSYHGGYHASERMGMGHNRHRAY